MARLEDWVMQQLEILSSEHSTAVMTRITVQGPDGATWATFPRETDELAIKVSRAVDQISAELSKGQHAFLAVSWAGTEQIACLPITRAGQSAMATSAASESKVYAQSTSMHLQNSETVIEQLRSENSRLGTQISNLLDDQVSLLDSLLKYRTQNLNHELAVQEAEANAKVREQLLVYAEPLFGLLVEKFSKKLEKKE